MLFDIEFYNALDKLEESIETYTGPKSERPAKAININNSRVITSDVTDVRGELEKSSCIDYYPSGCTEPVLTRLQVRTIILRDGENGKEFLGKKFSYRLQLPGGGFDTDKDYTVIDTAIREAWEESNIKLVNVFDTGLTQWRYREDDFVLKHIENPNDRWYGYYSFFVIGEYDGKSNNTNPEELGKYKWYPIEDLKKQYKDIYDLIISKNLDEAWGDGSHGKQDESIPGVISYCCENIFTLEKILEESSKVFIKAANQEETFELDNEPHKYISFSRQLFSHAARRPNKWSFGIAVNEQELEKDLGRLKNKGGVFGIGNRGHHYGSLVFSRVYDAGGKFILFSYLYGYVEVSKDIADLVVNVMQRKSEKLQNSDYVASQTRGKRKRQEKTEEQKSNWDLVLVSDSIENKSSANTLLKQLGCKEVWTFRGVLNVDVDTNEPINRGNSHDRDYSVSFINDDFTDEEKDILLDYLLGETYYNEGETRVWILDNNKDGIYLSKNAIDGIIVPEPVDKYIMNAARFSLNNSSDAAFNEWLEKISQDTDCPFNKNLPFLQSVWVIGNSIKKSAFRYNIYSHPFYSPANWNKISAISHAITTNFGR